MNKTLLLLLLLAATFGSSAQAGLLTYRLSSGSTITPLNSDNTETLRGYFTWELVSNTGNSLVMVPRSLEFFSDSFSLSLKVRPFNNRATAIFFNNDPNRCLSSSCLTSFGAVVTAIGFDTGDTPLSLGGFGAYEGEPLMPTSVSYENLGLLPADHGGRFQALVNLNAVRVPLPPTILIFLTGLTLLGLKRLKKT